MHPIRRRHSPFLRLLLLGLLAISLLGNGWAVAVAAVPAAGEPCAMMMGSGSHGDCCDHGQPGKPMPADCVEHCFLLGHSVGSFLVPVLPSVGLRIQSDPVPLTRLALGRLPRLSAPELRPPISV
jgi:hypothetical protein